MVSKNAFNQLNLIEATGIAGIMTLIQCDIPQEQAADVAYCIIRLIMTCTMTEAFSAEGTKKEKESLAGMMRKEAYMYKERLSLHLETMNERKATQ
jgi:hypothetical protein